MASKKVYIVFNEDWGVMNSILAFSTKAKALKELKAEMREALKSSTLTAEEKKAVRRQVESSMAFDIDLDEHCVHGYIVEREVY